MKSTKPLNFEFPNVLSVSDKLTRPKFLIAASFLLFISFTGLYLYFSPNLASQPWDSLEYAYSTEEIGIKTVRGNHPLGHAILYTIFALAKQVGYNGRALNVFQSANSVIAGLIIATFFSVLVSLIKVRTQYAAGFSLVLGASYGFWFFAGTGDIYHLSILFSLLAWASFIFEITLRHRPFPILSGILAGVSILFHQLNIVLIPAGLALILLTPIAKDKAKNLKIKQIVLFTGATLAMAGLGYLVLGSIATSSFSLARVIGWMRGHFGDTTYGRYLTVEYFKTAWMTLSQGVLFSPKLRYEFVSHGVLASILLMILVALLANKALRSRKRAIFLASALECLLTWPLILWWEPQNPKFWLLTLIPWMILLALSFEALETSLRNRQPRFGTRLSRSLNVLPMIVGIVILSINAPYTNGKEDPVAFNEAFDVWMNNSNPNDVLITAGDLIPHLRYWGKRPNTVYLYRSIQKSQTFKDDFYDLRTKINKALCTHHTVLITPAASEYVSDSELSLVGVSREELRSFLDEKAHHGEIAFWYRDVFDGKQLPVYALTDPEAC